MRDFVLVSGGEREKREPERDWKRREKCKESEWFGGENKEVFTFWSNQQL